MTEFDWKAKWLAITPKPFALFSILGSVCIMKYVRSSDKRRESIYHRLLLGLSVYDFVGSAAILVGTWAIPRDTSGVYMASGTQGTCSAQGFFVQMGIGTPLYNASLSLYYFLVIMLGWNERKMRKIEVWLHAVPNVITIGTSIAGATILNTEGHMGLYHNSNLWCWIAPPAHPAYRLIFYYGPVWACIAIATFSMCAIYYHVLITERKTAKQQLARYNTASRDSPSDNSSVSTKNNGTESVLKSALRHRENKSTSNKIASQGKVFDELVCYFVLLSHLTCSPFLHVDHHC